MLRKWIKNERGQAMVESALVLPIIILLLLGMVELGRLSNAYLSVMHAARHGARQGAVGASNEEIKASVVRAATHLDETELIVVIEPATGRRSGQDIKVTVTYPVKMITPLTGAVFKAAVKVTSDVTMLLE